MHRSVLSSQRGERAGGLEQAPAETSAARARCIQSAVAGRRYPNLRSLRLFSHRLCLPAWRGVGWFRGAGLGAQVSVPVRHPRAACRPCGQVYDGMAPRLYVLQKHAEQVQLTAIRRRGFNTHTFFRDGSFWGTVPQPLSDAPRSAIPCGRAACHTRDTLAVLQGCGFRPFLTPRTPALRPGRHPSVPVAMSSMWFL